MQRESVNRMGLALSICMLLGMIACKKSSPEKTKAEIITQSSWKYDHATISGIDISSYLESCDKDNTVLFVSGGTGTLDEGATRCDDSDPQTISFTWEFQSNETILHASTPLFPGGNGDFTVVTITEQQLVISQDAVVSGSTQRVEITLHH